MFELMRALKAETTPAVQIWVNVMTAVMMASVFFMFDQTTALLVFLSAIGSLIIGVAVFKATRIVHLMGVGHLPLWAPLLYFIATNDFAGGIDATNVYHLWLAGASAVMAISLIFDVREVVLAAQGQRKAYVAA